MFSPFIWIKKGGCPGKKKKTMMEYRLLIDSEEEEEDYQKMMRKIFCGAIERIEKELNNIPNDAEKCAFLDYAIKAVKQDIIGSKRAAIFYQKDSTNLFNIFPFSGVNSGEEIDCNLVDVDLLAEPYRFDKLRGAVCDLYHTAFDYDKGKYSGIYYPEVNLLRIGNGVHHSAVAASNKEGIIKKCSVIRLTQFFPYYSTDGALWIDSRKEKYKKVLGFTLHSQDKVEDFRFAILYTLAKKKHDIISNSAL